LSEDYDERDHDERREGVTDDLAEPFELVGRLIEKQHWALPAAGLLPVVSAVILPTYDYKDCKHSRSYQHPMLDTPIVNIKIGDKPIEKRLHPDPPPSKDATC
jgi:hypothetical protein